VGGWDPDDGDGFAVERLSAPHESGLAHGVGLEGMRERAQLVGAELTIDSRPGAGTSVRVSVLAKAPSPDQSISP
jgi:two-component system sensor histidine kinase UhpB